MDKRTPAGVRRWNGFFWLIKVIVETEGLALQIRALAALESRARARTRMRQAVKREAEEDWGRWSSAKARLSSPLPWVIFAATGAEIC